MPKKSLPDSKTLIYNKAKELFYKKGLTETRYDEITRSCGLNPAMLKYHFQSKNKLAAEIYYEFELSLHKQIIDLADKSTPPELIYYYNILMFYNIVEKNEYFRRFYLDMCRSRMICDFTKNSSLYFFMRYCEDTSTQISEDKNRFNVTITVAAQMELMNDFYSGELNCTFKELIDQYLKLVFSYLLETEDTIEKNIDLGRSFSDKLKFSINENFDLNVYF